MTIWGLITDQLGDELYRLAQQVPADQAIVELGSFEGKSTFYLATGAQDGAGAQVYAVDLWDDRRNDSRHRHRYSDPSHRLAFQQNIHTLELRMPVIQCQAMSHEAALHYDGPPVGLLYVDADHREEAVRRDVNAWRRHLAPGAVVALDDWGTAKNPGVRTVVDEMGYPYSVAAERLAIVRLP